MASQHVFTVGGTVQAGRGRYVKRSVDDQLIGLCRSGRFAFVLSARQMGKSSLMVHTAEQLAAEGTRTLIVDLSQIGVQVTQEAWYLSLLTTAEDKLALQTDAFEWWEHHGHLSYPQRLVTFFREVLLREISGPVVIFIDEIDSTLGLGFTDDFFAAIRYVYNARSSDPEFDRLSFVLIGVATPNDLIDDPRRTPFNVGTEVDVGYFNLDEAIRLADGFDYPPPLARQVLSWILEWTSGHPYLTQRLCSVVASRFQGTVTKEDVTAAVADTFFRESGEIDTNLRFVRDMLTRWAPDLTAVLGTYEDLLRGRPVEDDRQSPIVAHLKLAGVARLSDGHLRLSTPIYRKVFDRAWLKKQWPEHWIKRVPKTALGLVAALFVITILTALFVVQTQRTSQAVERNNLQEELNEQLRAQVAVSDSLRMRSDDANLRLSTSNDLLSDQIRISDSLKAGTEAINERLAEQVVVSDSLRGETESANDRLVAQVLISDSLRATAEARLDETRAARLETVTIALASKAQRRIRLGDAALGGLLARQAYEFSQQSGGDFIDPVYHALVVALNALEPSTDDSRPYPRIFPDFRGEVRVVAFGPDGRLVVGNEDGYITFIDLGTGETSRFAAHDGPVRFATFSEIGGSSVLLTGGYDGKLIAWHEPFGTAPNGRMFGHHTGGVWSAALDNDAGVLATTGADDTVRVWTENGEGLQLAASLPAASPIRSLAFVGGGERLMTASVDGDIADYDWRSGRPPRTIASALGRINALAVSPEGDRLAAGGDLGVVHMWELSGSDIIAGSDFELRGHEGPVNALVFGPDGSTLASGSADRSVQLWRVDRPDLSPILLQDHSGWVWTLAYDATGSRLASGGADRTAIVWTASPDELAARICDVVGERQIGRDEWGQLVGNDFSYDESYRPCPEATTMSSSRAWDR